MNSIAGFSGTGLFSHPSSDLFKFLNDELSHKRLGHSLRVAKTASLYAHRLGLSATSAWIAGLAHDLAREWDGHKIINYVQSHGIPVSEEARQSPVLLHGLAAAIFVKERFNLFQEDILEAIENHTLGKAGMGPLAKVLFAADYLEPGRGFTTIGFRRSTHKICLACLVSRVVEHSASRFPEIHPQTAALYAETMHQCSCIEVKQ